MQKCNNANGSIVPTNTQTNQNHQAMVHKMHSMALKEDN